MWNHAEIGAFNLRTARWSVKEVSAMEESTETFGVQDLGDAAVETKQQSPLGPFWDSYYGHGWSMG